MTTLPYTALLIALVLAGPTRGDPPPDAAGLHVQVMTFNIRYGTADDRDNAWPHRSHLVCDIIRRNGGDFVGLQEALRSQIDAIRKAVPGYDEIGVGRDDGLTRGEYSAILYRADRWKVEENGTFWLSDTPDGIASKSWGNEITRIVTWGRFIERESGRALFVFNTHFDHQSQPSRVKSAELLARRIAERNPRDPVVVTGDFNAGEDNPAIPILKGAVQSSPVQLVDTFRVLHADARDVGTFNGFHGVTTGPKIDYVFVEPDARVSAARILRDNVDGRYPSDHFPVIAEIVFSGAAQ